MKYHQRFPAGGLTLIGSSSGGKVLDMWVYLGVFGLDQWFILAAILAIIVLIFMLMPHIGKPKQEPSFVDKASEGMSTVFLYTMQLGGHPKESSMGKRVLLLTVSLLTLCIFAYYTQDVTAQMTSRKILQKESLMISYSELYCKP